MYEQKIIENLRDFTAKYQYEDQKLSETCLRAADAIEELTDRNVGKWIPVTERLPENDKTVLVWNRRNSREYFDIYDHGRWIILEWEDITHWMLLPEPPKEEK